MNKLFSEQSIGTITCMSHVLYWDSQDTRLHIYTYICLLKNLSSLFLKRLALTYWQSWINSECHYIACLGEMESPNTGRDAGLSPEKNRWQWED